MNMATLMSYFRCKQIRIGLNTEHFVPLWMDRIDPMWAAIFAHNYGLTVRRIKR